MNETMLLATFTRVGNVRRVVSLIKREFDLSSNKIFILGDKRRKGTRIITYNVFRNNDKFSDVVKNTISLHRKKETNTLYTLNALNEVVKEQNGVVDKNFEVDWEKFRNTMLITYKNDETGENVLKKIRTFLIKIISIKIDDEDFEEGDE